MKVLFAFLVSFSLYQIANTQVVSLIAENVTAVYNQSAILNCTAIVNDTLLDDETFNITIKNSLGETLADSDHSDDEVLIVEISNVDITDRGEYSCIVVTIDQVLNTSFFLTVENFEFKVVSPPLSVNQSLGSPVNFTCVFNHKFDTVEWKKNNIELINYDNINTTHSISVFYFPGITYSNIGVYKCIGRLLEYTAQAEASLTVREYRPLYINNSNNNSIISNENTQYLSCEIYGNPTPIYLWIYNGTNVTSNSSITGPYVAQNNSLILSNAVPSNSGIYTCYGIDSVSNRNLSISYNVTIYHQEVRGLPIDWYIFAIIGIVAVTIIVMIIIVIWFIRANTDILQSKDIQKSKKIEKRRKEVKSQEIANNEFGFYAPNVIYQDEFISSSDESHEPIQEDNETIHTTITEYDPHTQEVTKTRLPPVSKYKYLTNPDDIMTRPLVIDTAVNGPVEIDIPLQDETTDITEDITSPPDVLVESKIKSKKRRTSTEQSPIFNNISSSRKPSKKTRAPKRDITDESADIVPLVDTVPDTTVHILPPEDTVPDTTVHVLPPEDTVPDTTVHVLPPEDTVPDTTVPDTTALPASIKPAKKKKKKSKPSWKVQEDEKPKQSSDGTYYMETVYIPPPEDESEDDEDIIPPQEEPIIVPPSVDNKVPSVTTLTSESSVTQMASESVTITMDAANDSSSENDESTIDLEKIMAQHTATETDIWPWKPTIQLSQLTSEPELVLPKLETTAAPRRKDSVTKKRRGSLSNSKRRNSVHEVAPNKEMQVKRRSSVGEIDLSKISKVSKEGSLKRPGKDSSEDKKKKNERQAPQKKKKSKSNLYTADVFY